MSTPQLARTWPNFRSATKVPPRKALTTGVRYREQATQYGTQLHRARGEHRTGRARLATRAPRRARIVDGSCNNEFQILKAGEYRAPYAVDVRTSRSHRK